MTWTPEQKAQIEQIYQQMLCVTDAKRLKLPHHLRGTCWPPYDESKDIWYKDARIVWEKPPTLKDAITAKQADTFVNDIGGASSYWQGYRDGLAWVKQWLEGNQ